MLSTLPSSAAVPVLPAVTPKVTSKVALMAQLLQVSVPAADALPMLRWRLAAMVLFSPLSVPLSTISRLKLMSLPEVPVLMLPAVMLKSKLPTKSPTKVKSMSELGRKLPFALEPYKITVLI